MKSLQTITLPENIFGFIVTKARMAQCGIQCHAGSFHIDPNSSGKITFEISNVSRNKIKIYPFMEIAKIYFDFVV